MGRREKSPKSAGPRRNYFPVGRSRLSLVFEDEFCLVGPDRIDPVTGEQRWHAIGAVRNEPGSVSVLFVVHVYREEHNGEEIIRIVSARAAEKHELRRYQEQAFD
jgi:uncharacterized DUF497 family protein